MIAYLSIGSNIGNTTENLQKAVVLIERYVGETMRVSDVYRSMPQGFDSKNEFANIAVKINTKLSPEELLLQTQKIEKQLGRTEKTHIDDCGKPIYTDRIIDIDILEYENVVMSTKDLVLPHPRIAERDFVIIPLMQVKEQKDV